MAIMSYLLHTICIQGLKFKVNPKPYSLNPPSRPVQGFTQLLMSPCAVDCVNADGICEFQVSQPLCTNKLSKLGWTDCSTIGGF